MMEFSENATLADVIRELSPNYSGDLQLSILTGVLGNFDDLFYDQVSPTDVVTVTELPRTCRFHSPKWDKELTVGLEETVNQVIVKLRADDPHELVLYLDYEESPLRSDAAFLEEVGRDRITNVAIRDLEYSFAYKDRTHSVRLSDDATFRDCWAGVSTAFELDAIDPDRISFRVTPDTFSLDADPPANLFQNHLFDKKLQIEVSPTVYYLLHLLDDETKGDFCRLPEAATVADAFVHLTDQHGRHVHLEVNGKKLSRLSTVPLLSVTEYPRQLWYRLRDFKWRLRLPGEEEPVAVTGYRLPAGITVDQLRQRWSFAPDTDEKKIVFTDHSEDIPPERFAAIFHGEPLKPAQELLKLNAHETKDPGMVITLKLYRREYTFACEDRKDKRRFPASASCEDAWQAVKEVLFASGPDREADPDQVEFETADGRKFNRSAPLLRDYYAFDSQIKVTVSKPSYRFEFPMLHPPAIPDASPMAYCVTVKQLYDLITGKVTNQLHLTLVGDTGELDPASTTTLWSVTSYPRKITVRLRDFEYLIELPGCKRTPYQLFWGIRATDLKQKCHATESLDRPLEIGEPGPGNFRVDRLEISRSDGAPLDDRAVLSDDRLGLRENPH
jgi:hypothetical protein